MLNRSAVGLAVVLSVLVVGDAVAQRVVPDLKLKVPSKGTALSYGYWSTDGRSFNSVQARLLRRFPEEVRQEVKKIDGTRRTFVTSFLEGDRWYGFQVQVSTQEELKDQELSRVRAAFKAAVKLSFNRLIGNPAFQLIRATELVPIQKELTKTEPIDQVNTVFRLADSGNASQWPWWRDHNWGLRRVRPQGCTSAPRCRPVVAVLDSGVDWDHPWFPEDSCWKNSAEVGGTAGVDDDGNGYTDDRLGYDFRAGYFAKGNPRDPIGHGTHCSGVVLQVEPHARIMNLAVFDADSMAPRCELAAAIDYATAQRVQVINMSFGQFDLEWPKAESPETDPPDIIFAALKRASDRGIVLVAAAGNHSLDYDIFTKLRFLPACYSDYKEPPDDNEDSGYREPSDDMKFRLISVGALREGGLAPFSNHGDDLVQIYAPGQAILSCDLNEMNVLRDGTSSAAACVSGGAAAVWESLCRPGHVPSRDDVINRLLEDVVRGKRSEGHPELNLTRLGTP